jgi:PAS domain S-box-containing protein
VSRQEKGRSVNDSLALAEVASAAGAVDERWFRAVADYTYDWESWHAPEGRLIWVNPAVERVTGYSVAECLAMADYPLPMVAPEDRDRIAKLLTSARNRTSGENVEFRSLRRAGEVRWMSLAWQPMYERRGDYLGFRTSARDVTERQKLREQLRLHAEHLEQLVEERTSRLRQLEQRQRQIEKLAALGQLAAGVAHEINNPLAGMRNAFELIKSDLSPEHEHYELLGLIDREIERISGITHQMYQLYRRAPQPPSEFALERIVGEVAYLVENLARKHHVALRCEPPAASVPVLLAEGEVKQILYNLMRNAIQASPAGEEVTVRIADDAREVAVQVSDRGPGMPADVLSRIFDPFFSTKQGDVSQSGMGLGLSVSRSLVEAMGGRIEVADETGRGSRFTAVFPRRLETLQERGDG